jgi:hypothetical protein
MAVLAGVASADVVQYTASPGSYPALPSALVREFGTASFPPNAETTLTYYDVPGTGSVTLTFRFHADTGSFFFNFGLYRYTAALANIDLSTTAGKMEYATQALAPDNAVLVFDDRVHNPGTNRTVTVNGGDVLGFFLIPDASLAQFQTNQSAFAVNGVGSATLGWPGQNRWPLFGVAEANPGDRDQLMSFRGTSVATGRSSSLFAWEDLTRATISGNGLPSDNNFNDLSFGVEGVAEVGASAVVILQRPPAANYVRPGSNVVFQVAAAGQPPLHYQWFLNQTNALADATNASYTIIGAGPEHEGHYSVLVSNALGSVVVSNILLTLLVPPMLVQPVPPLNLAVAAGEDVTIGVEVTGTLPISFRWRRGSSTLTNDYPAFRHTSFYTLRNVQPPTVSGQTNITVALTNVASLPDVVLATVASLIVLADGDGDRMPDQWETDHGTQPQVNDGSDDPDQDGLSNYQEYLACTHPTNANSFLRIEHISAADGAAISFVAAPNCTYTVQFKDGVQDVLWKKLADVVPRAVARLETLTDAAPGTNRIYRLVTPRQP